MHGVLGERLKIVWEEIGVEVLANLVESMDLVESMTRPAAALRAGSTNPRAKAQVVCSGPRIQQVDNRKGTFGSKNVNH